MRQLPKRQAISRKTLRKLAQKTHQIRHSEDQVATADRSYTNSRKSKWFSEIQIELKRIAGRGLKCMLCSGSESSDVEHFHPLAKFPQKALQYKNYLYSCPTCNRIKSTQFPLTTSLEGKFINPIDENPWDFFYIDQFGFLCPQYDKRKKRLNLRAENTCTLIKLNRDAIQHSREDKLKSLKREVFQAIKDLKTKVKQQTDVHLLIQEWIKDCTQPDVADFFLSGPGRNERPFSELFDLLKS